MSSAQNDFIKHKIILELEILQEKYQQTAVYKKQRLRDRVLLYWSIAFMALVISLLVWIIYDGIAI